MASMSGSENYVTHDELEDAIETAIALGQPLLVTGDPGCGKTELGDYVAHRQGLGRAIPFETKAQMIARDLFDTFDTLGRFHAAQLAGKRAGPDDPLRFVEYRALGEAIIRASPPGRYRHLLPPGYDDSEQKQSVVLIDEVDKAPRDVPNDLLRDLEQLRFRVPELDRIARAGQPERMAVIELAPEDRDYRPIVVFTSNSEKALPDAFLRRCVYYHMPFPVRDQLLEIVRKRLGYDWGGSELARDVVAVTRHAKENRQLRKPPGTAEMLGLLLALRHKGYGPGDRLQGSRGWHSLGAITLLKTRDDQQRATALFEGVDWALGRTA
jgi:MoxR-like ATPase